MELIIIYLLTIILSFIGELSNSFLMFKDVASAGYKIDIKKLSEITKKLNSNNQNNSLIRILIPFYNLYKVLETRSKYVQQREFILPELNVLDVVEEMTEYEKNEFQKKPTGLNAIVVMAKSSINNEKEVNQERVTLTGFKNDWLIYSTNEKTGEIDIIKTEGKFSNFSLEKQKKYVLQRKNFEMVEEKEEKSEPIIEISLTDRGMTREEKIKELEGVKEELLKLNITEEKMPLFMDAIKMVQNSEEETKTIQKNNNK